MHQVVTVTVTVAVIVYQSWKAVLSTLPLYYHTPTPSIRASTTTLHNTYNKSTTLPHSQHEPSEFLCSTLGSRTIPIRLPIQHVGPTTPIRASYICFTLCTTASSTSILPTTSLFPSRAGRQYQYHRSRTGSTSPVTVPGPRQQCRTSLHRLRASSGLLAPPTRM